MEERETPQGLERRSFLKRAALVSAGAVWATPTVHSLVSPAFATGTGTCPPGRMWRFKVNAGGGFDSGNTSGGGAGWCLPEGYAAAQPVPNAPGYTTSFLVDGKTYTITVQFLNSKTAHVTITGGALIEDLVAKAGSSTGGECDDIHEYVDPDTAELVLVRKSISFVAGVICIPPR